MKANQAAVLFMLSTVLTAVHALTVETPQKKLEAVRDKNATLQCIFHTSATILQDGGIISWRKIPVMEEFASKAIARGTEYKGNYVDRLTFSGNVNSGNGSITLSQVTMDDNGTYECSVRLFADPPSKMVEIDLLVLVSPSKPKCTIIGKAEYGQNINLTCHSDEGSPQPRYTWQSYDAQNQSRQLAGTQLPGGLLMLKNVSAGTTGYYICLSENSAGKNMCNVSLAVIPMSMNFALYGGIIGGLVAVIIIVIVVAYCCCCRKSKDKEYEATETKDGYQPQREPIRIRGPDEEEIQEEEDDDKRNNPQMRLTRPVSQSSDIVA